MRVSHPLPRSADQLSCRVFAWLHLEQLLSTEFVCHVFREATLTQYEVRTSRLKDSLQQQGAIYRSINKESNFEASLSTPEARAEPAAELESVTPDDDDWGDWEDDWGEDQTDQSEAEPIGSLSKPAIGRELEYLREPSNSGASIGWGFSVSFDFLCTELPLNRVYHQSGDPFLMDQAGLLVAGLDLQSQLDVRNQHYALALTTHANTHCCWKCPQQHSVCTTTLSTHTQ